MKSMNSSTIMAVALFTLKKEGKLLTLDFLVTVENRAGGQHTSSRVGI